MSYLEFPVVGTVYLRARRRGLSSSVVKVSSYTVGCSTSADITRTGRLWPKTTNGSALAKSKRSGGASWSTFTGYEKLASKKVAIKILDKFNNLMVMIISIKQ